MNKDLATPVISIISCFYNEKKFLEEAMNSVLSLNYTHWEYILIDDGSIDGSSAVARHYAESYPDKIHYYEHEGHFNKGLSFSRNFGISKAVGKYVAFLDGDDVFLPSRFDETLTIMEDRPQVAICLEATEYWYNWNDPNQENVVVPIGAREGLYPPQTLSIMLYPLGLGQAPCTSSLLVRKTALVDLGGFEEHFNKEYALYEDQAFLCKFYLGAWTYVSERCTSRYRQHAESIVYTVKRQGNYEKVRRYFLKYLSTYMREHEIKNKEISIMIWKELLKLNPVIRFFLR